MERNDTDRRKSLFEIKADALLLQHNMSSHLMGEALYTQMEYERLVEKFYTGCRESCSEEDYEAAKREFDVFMRLLDAAIAREHREPNGSDKT
jgi:hypothetical protein